MPPIPVNEGAVGFKSVGCIHLSFGAFPEAVANLPLPSFPRILISQGKKPLYGNRFCGSLNPGQPDRGRFDCLSFSIPGGLAPQLPSLPSLSLRDHLEVKATAAGAGGGHFYTSMANSWPKAAKMPCGRVRYSSAKPPKFSGGVFLLTLAGALV